MNKEIAKIYGACNPNSPADRKFYYDCSKARGGNVFVEQMIEHISLANASMHAFSDTSDYKCFLFTGHSGCGKSSELKRLTREISAYSEDKRFYPIFIDANEYLERFDVTITDILLAIATETADILLQDQKIKIKGNFFQQTYQKLKETVFSEWEMETISVDLPFIFSKIDMKRLAKDESARQKVRSALKGETYLLLSEINNLLSAARKAIQGLKAHGKSLYYQDIVIILDNLEKIEKFDDAEMGLESAQRLFVNYSTQLTDIKSHIIYTVPIDLMRSSNQKILTTLYDKSFVLPMVKIFQRDGVTPFPVGIENMKKLLAKRLDKLKLEQAFTKDALDLLIQYSGGHIRTFMVLARESCTDAEKLPINADNVNYAIDGEYQNISPSFFPEYVWEVLAGLDLSQSQGLGTEPEKCVEMLEKLLLFEYLNGDDETKTKSGKRDRNKQTPWYAVNPLYRELEQFTSAKERIENKTNKEDEVEQQ